MTLASLIPVAFSASIFLLVLGIGLDTTWRDATYLLRHPAQLGRSLAAMYLAMPALAVALALAFDLNPAVKIALVAAAVSPVPPFLPLTAINAGGARNYTIGLLAAASAVAIVVVPLAVGLVGRIFALPLAMPAAAVAELVTLSVLAPLAVGVALRQSAPDVADRLAKPAHASSALLLVVALLPVLATAWRGMVSLIGDGTVLALAAFAAAGLLVGHLLGGPRPEGRTVLALASSSRHPGVAVAIAHANFPDDGNVLAAVLLYLVVAAIVAAPYLRWVRR